jgi:hypothetical protein
LPIFFIEIKTFSNLEHESTHEKADEQMHKRFDNILHSESFCPILLPALTGISAIGTHFAVYWCMTHNGVVSPPQIQHHPLYCTDTAPRERWNHDVMEGSGEVRLRALTNEVKQMVISHQQ